MKMISKNFKRKWEVNMTFIAIFFFVVCVWIGWKLKTYQIESKEKLIKVVDKLSFKKFLKLN